MKYLGITFLPTFWGFMAAFSESIGAFLIGIGLGTRIAAGLLMITMLVGVNMHITTGEGSPEMALLYAFASAALMLAGAGDLSLDKKLFSADK
jgi:putative oxidoreductase